MKKLGEFLFDNPIGKLVSMGIGLVALISAYWVHIEKQRGIGERRAIEKVKANNEQVHKKASAASDKSLDPAARGVLNPYYRGN